MEDVNSGVIGIIGVVVGIAITGIKEVFFDKAKRERKARFLAIKLVCLLDEFVESCLLVSTDDGSVYGQFHPEHGAQVQVKIPKLHLSNLGDDWELLKYDFTYEILLLPLKMEEANQSIEFVFDQSFPPEKEEGFIERQTQYSKLGIEAYNIALEMRKHYKIPQRKYLRKTPEKRFRDKIEKYSESK